MTGHRIPRIGATAPDGLAADWWDAGFAMPLRADAGGAVPDPAELGAELRLGWNGLGLWLALRVRDAELADGHPWPWESDCVEIFVTGSADGQDLVQFVLAPGAGAARPRMMALDGRGSRRLLAVPPGSRHAVVATPGGYAVEALIPLPQLGAAPTLGTLIGFNLRVRAGATGTAASRIFLDAFHQCGGLTKRRSLRLLRLADAAGPAPALEVKGCAGGGRWTAAILAAPSLAGRVVEVRRDGTLLASGTLRAAGSHAEVRLALPVPTDLSGPTHGDVMLGDEAVERIDYLTMDRQGDGEEAMREMVNRYLHEDRVSPPPPGATLLLGHSQLHFWYTFRDDLAPHPVINRGLGGSRVHHLLRWLDELALRHRPARVLLMIGGNDLPALSPEEIVAGNAELVARLRRTLPGVGIWLLGEVICAGNHGDGERRRLIRLKQDLAARLGAGWLDVADAACGADGRPAEDHFAFDRTHVGPKAYARWSGLIQRQVFGRLA